MSNKEQAQSFSEEKTLEKVKLARRVFDVVEKFTKERCKEKSADNRAIFYLDMLELKARLSNVLN